MSNTRFKLYLASVFALARTLVIKHDGIAQAVNSGLLMQRYPVDTNDKSSWKYYQNLAGMRHVTDPVITIRSIEDGIVQDIEFTRANLLARPATAREYLYGSRFYNDLLRRYPNQETRILGILYPVVENADANIGMLLSVEKAINADDGTILRFDSSLVEDNEIDLIPRLEEWIKIFLRQWTVPEYAITDDLYYQVALGVMYAALPQAILNIRLSNCHTGRAHSFHIREFLESNGKLGEHVDLLTKKQALWLYRNIRYIHHYPGRQSTFEWLVENVMTERRLPLASYDLRHNLREQPLEVSPIVDAVRTAVNFKQVGTGSDTVTLEYLLGKEVLLSRDESMDVAIEEVYTDLVANDSLNNRLPTKVLESSVIDTTDSVIYPLIDVLWNNWIYRASHNRFNATVFYTHPLTGNREMISPLDALILYLYSFNYAEGLDDSGDPFETIEIPKIDAFDVLRTPVPDIDDLASVVAIDRVGLPALAEVLYDPLYVPSNFISTDAFYDSMVAVQSYMLEKRKLYVKEDDYRIRAYMEKAVSMLYMDLECTLATPGTTYAEWFEIKGIDVTGMSVSDHRRLYTELFKTTLGIGENVSKNLRELQASMLKLMRRLSSYNIQFLRTINTDSQIIEDRVMLRGGDLNERLFDSSRVDLPGTFCVDQGGQFHMSLATAIIGSEFAKPPAYRIHDGVFVNLSSFVKFKDNTFDTMRVLVPRVMAEIIDPTTENLGIIITTSEVPEYENPTP